jgi:hypothetical protein
MDTRLGRIVATRLIKACIGTCEVVARFESEHQLLVLMDHPPSQGWTGLARRVSTAREGSRPRWQRMPALWLYTQVALLLARMALQMSLRRCREVRPDSSSNPSRPPRTLRKLERKSWKTVFLGSQTYQTLPALRHPEKLTAEHHCGDICGCSLATAS